MKNLWQICFAALVAAGVTTPAAAQSGERVIGLELGAGVQYAPEYEGSDQYSAGPTGTVALTRLQFGRIDFARADDTGGFSIGPSFRYLKQRDSSRFAALAGIGDNDAAVELGVRLGYDWERFSAFGQVRKGVTGHDGLAGEIGMDTRFGLSDKTTLTFGPRAAFGDDSYMSYAFDVPGTATALPAYDAKGGLKSVGAELRLRHALSDRTFLDGWLAYDRFEGDAANSPIVKAGDRDQLRIGIMLVRQFQIRF